MDVRRADLHMHTCFSDGVLSPSELVRTARRHGIHGLAVTDHDSVAGVPEAVVAGKKYGVEIITGVELSVSVAGCEVHLLGYLFDPDYKPFEERLKEVRADRADRAVKMISRFQDLGIEIELPVAAADKGTVSVGRPHLAAALMKGGYVESYKDAFARYLKDGGPAHVAKAPFPAEEALSLIHAAGGIGVLAHPASWVSDDTVLALVRAGLDGIEIVHPSHPVGLVRHYQAIARQHFLIETGGSDFHGSRPDEEKNLGRFSISYSQFNRIRGAVV